MAIETDLGNLEKLFNFQLIFYSMSIVCREKCKMVSLQQQQQNITRKHKRWIKMIILNHFQSLLWN